MLALKIVGVSAMRSRHWRQWLGLGLLCAEVMMGVEEGGGWVGMTPVRIAVCSGRRLLASRHFPLP